MNTDFQRKLIEFFEKTDLTIGSVEEFKKGQNDFKTWGEGIIFGSRNWIINKLSNKLAEIDAPNLSIMPTMRNSGNQKSDLIGFTARIQAVLKNGMMAGYFIGRVETDLYGLFGYQINLNETEIIKDMREEIKEPNQKEIGEPCNSDNVFDEKAEEVEAAQTKMVESEYCAQSTRAEISESTMSATTKDLSKQDSASKSEMEHETLKNCEKTGPNKANKVIQKIAHILSLIAGVVIWQRIGGPVGLLLAALAVGFIEIAFKLILWIIYSPFSILKKP